MLLRNTMILRPYVRPLRRYPAIAIKTSAYALLVLFALIYGYAITILPPELLFIPATPLAILVGLILWALPDINRVPKAVSAGVLGFFLATNYMWPSYVAINLPGLPWLNPQRISLFILLVTALYGYATSSKMRSETLMVARADPLIWKPFAVFWFCSLLALPLAGSAFTVSMNSWLNKQVYWTFMFFITAFIVQKPGTFLTLARALMVAAIVVSLITIPEYIGKKVPWIDYVPSWLVGDPLIFERVRSDQGRLNISMYRARSTFGVSLSLAEFLSLALPFFLHAFAEEKALLKKALFAASILLIAYSMSILTGARSGTNGLVIGLFGYAAFWTIRRWRMYRHDLIGPAALLSFPAAVLAFAGLTLVWNRLRVMVLGGGQHSYSNKAREEQWAIAIDKLIQNPFGYGSGSTGRVIAYTNPGGELTVDSYYINLLIDNGVIGFLAFMALIIGTVIVAVRNSLFTDEKEQLLAAPVAVALVALLVIKSVLSQVENLPILFIFAGAISGLALRARKPAAEQPASAPTSFSRTQSSFA